MNAADTSQQFECAREPACWVCVAPSVVVLRPGAPASHVRSLSAPEDAMANTANTSKYQRRPMLSFHESISMQLAPTGAGTECDCAMGILVTSSNTSHVRMTLWQSIYAFLRSFIFIPIFGFLRHAQHQILLRAELPVWPPVALCVCETYQT